MKKMEKEKNLQNIIKVIKGIAPECCEDFSKLNENTRLDDHLHFDSMNYVMLATSLEEQFDLVLKKEEVLQLHKIGDIIALIEKTNK